MAVLEITIQRKLGDIWPVVLERSQDGELPVRAEGELSLGVDWREQLLKVDHDPLAYGMVLGKALFRDDVRDVFVHCPQRKRRQRWLSARRIDTRLPGSPWRWFGSGLA